MKDTDEPDHEVVRFPPGRRPVLVAAGPGRTSDALLGAMEPDEIARSTLEALRVRHRDLDAAIAALAERGADPLTVRRLKKRKLMLRDRIAVIEDRLTPDIIA